MPEPPHRFFDRVETEFGRRVRQCLVVFMSITAVVVAARLLWWVMSL